MVLVRDYNQLEESHTMLTTMNIYWSSLSAVVKQTKKTHRQAPVPLILLFHGEEKPKVNQNDSILEGQMNI